MPGPTTPHCQMCKDGDLIVINGEYQVCMAPHTEGRRREIQARATEANETLKKLERRTASKR